MKKIKLTDAEIMRDFPYVVENWNRGGELFEKIIWLNDTFGLDAADTLWAAQPIFNLRFKREEHYMLYVLRWL